MPDMNTDMRVTDGGDDDDDGLVFWVSVTVWMHETLPRGTR